MNTTVNLYKNGVLQSGVTPIFGKDVVLNRTREGGEMLFRESIEGTWNFLGSGYTLLRGASTSDKFELEVLVDNTLVGRGHFFKYDCEFDDDSQRAKVKVTYTDDYTKLLAQYSNEFDIVQLATPATSVDLTKRAVLQFYVPGETKLTNVIGGSSYEVDCEQYSDAEMVDEESTIHFGRIVNQEYLKIEYADIIDEPSRTEAQKALMRGLVGTMYRSLASLTPFVSTSYQIYHDAEITSYRRYKIARAGQYETLGWISGPNNSDIGYGQENWIYSSGGVHIGTIGWDRYTSVILWGRIVFDKDGVTGASTIAAEGDITAQNLNYHYCLPYPSTQLALSQVVYLNTRSATPTKWGKDKGGNYYAEPTRNSTTYEYPVIPLGASFWGTFSLWFFAPSSSIPGLVLENYESVATIKDTYALHDVVTTLLNQIDSTIKFSNTTDYSEFFYEETNPVSQIGNNEILIAPISNIKKSYYSSPAQKGKTSLKAILEMLRSCYQVYWFIETKTIGGVSTKCLRLEHISYFKKGYSYYGDATILADVTTMNAPRSGQSWASGISKFSYDKDSLPSRYEFGWATEATEIFNGYPIKTLDEEVQGNSKEEKTASPFDADIDTILAVPSIFGDDGFAIMEKNEYGKVPIATIGTEREDNAVRYYAQNGNLTFLALAQRYYLNSLGGTNNVLDGYLRTYPYEGKPAGENIPLYTTYTEEAKREEMLIKCMKQSSVVFPLSVSNIHGKGMIKTYIGSGIVSSLKWNIETGIATAEILFTPN